MEAHRNPAKNRWQLEWFRSGYGFSKAAKPDPKAKVGLNPSWSSCGSIPSRWRCQHWWIWMPRAGNLSAVLVGWCGRWTGELWWIFAPGIAHDPSRLDSSHSGSSELLYLMLWGLGSMTRINHTDFCLWISLGPWKFGTTKTPTFFWVR
jgi:hypothetical protein